MVYVKPTSNTYSDVRNNDIFPSYEDMRSILILARGQDYGVIVSGFSQLRKFLVSKSANFFLSHNFAYVSAREFKSARYFCSNS